MRPYFGSTKNIIIVVVVVLFSLYILVSCGESQYRDDSFDREQIQTCLNDNGTPIYEQYWYRMDDKMVIDFIACDK